MEWTKKDSLLESLEHFEKLVKFYTAERKKCKQELARKDLDAFEREFYEGMIKVLDKESRECWKMMESILSCNGDS